MKIIHQDEYGEVINGEMTYKAIAEGVRTGRGVIIGWTDEGCDHRDILFTLRPIKYGTLQRGLNFSSHLYVSIIGGSCMGFLIERDSNNVKHKSYIMEKLNLHENSCDAKICELINGVIHQLDMLEGNI